VLGELVALVLGVAALPFALAVGVAYGTRKVICPSCSKRAMQVVGVRRLFVGGDASTERMYRCGACKADFMRLGKGPFVPKRDWDAAGPAARAKLPPARLVDR
jgi:DNA-directed RNA polymerase subunit RPC12/RpoP